MQTSLKSRRILVYGDSITWGRIPGQQGRFDEDKRWTCILQKNLGNSYEVIEEGLRGRMLKGENPYFKDRDGLKQFGPILASGLPIDLLVIFLGTNDTNYAANKTPEKIAEGLNDYFKILDDWCQQFEMKLPKVLIISPPAVNESVLIPDSKFRGASAKADKLAELYSKIADTNGAMYFDALPIVQPSDEDGVHLNEAANLALATAIEPVIRNILIN